MTRLRMTINLTPMIDVVFLLLMFFLLTAQLGQSSVVEFEVAFEASGSNLAQGAISDPLLVEWDGEQFRLFGKEIDASSLAQLVASTDRPVALRPFGDMDTGAFIGGADQLRNWGAERLILVRGKS